MIVRENYIQKLREFKDLNLIKIITGIRRCGKSTLLKMFSQELQDKGIRKENIIEINFESLEYESLKQYKTLYNYVKQRINGSQKVYLFLDEIQEVEEWQKAINSFLVDFNVDIYITGSNAYFLSSEFATYLSGRYVEIKMLPMSFLEFIELHNLGKEISKEEKFELYFKYGGMPVIAGCNFNEERIYDILRGIYSTVILKDIIDRAKLSDQKMLSKITMFLSQNIGNIISPNKITNILIAEGDMKNEKKTSVPINRTTNNILDMLTKSFIFYPVQRYDIKGKQLLKTLEKYYIVDIGIRNMLAPYSGDRGHILENIVYLELLRRGYQIAIGKQNNLEVDFIAQKSNEKIYIQVTESLLSEDVKKRELAPLISIKDFYRKMIITLDRNYIDSENGIAIINIIDFLLNNKTFL